MHELLNYPFSPQAILRKKRSIKKKLLENGTFAEKRIAILGGSTVGELKDIFELFLLDAGIKPIFYESDYGRYYEEAVFGSPELDTFAPDLVYIHTTVMNITTFPAAQDSEAACDELLERQYADLECMWAKLSDKFGCTIIQNNFELPPYRPLGSLEAWDKRGGVVFINEMNRKMAEYARRNANFIIHDINHLAARLGLDKWHDRAFWHAYRYAMSYDSIPHLAHSLANSIKAIFGKTKKCLVLDLDNTLWGGVIGDDGLSGIRLGKETAEAAAHTEIQEYAKFLKQRGIMLGVCSKNDEANAREGFTHPDTVLNESDFTAFKANWMPKSQNLTELANEINIGLDSLVFLDDNPAEREIVRQQTPEVTVPEVGNGPELYPRMIDNAGYFEAVSLSKEDIKRSSFYAENAKRQAEQCKFTDYGTYLDSLEMSAVIGPFAPEDLERITQLTNKTNQFNLTTRRYTRAEIEEVNHGKSHLCLSGRLSDKFGDNGLVSVIIATQAEQKLHIDLWLMSCRVIKREMEHAMFDALIKRAQERGVREIHGYYLPTSKNGMVRNMYPEFGFRPASPKEDGGEVWTLEVNDNIKQLNKHIKVNHEQ